MYLSAFSKHHTYTAAFCTHSVCMSTQLLLSVRLHTHTRCTEKDACGYAYTDRSIYLSIYPSRTSGSRERFSASYFHAERKDLLNRVSFSKPEDVMSGFRTMDCGHF